MGVLGLAKLLREEGYLPADTSCVKTLWREHGGDLSEEALDRIVRIPSHSTLALDGNGLAYYLHHVAYSRHFNQVTGGEASTSTSSCCCNTKNLSETQVTRLLPLYMPLSVLEQVTKEFVQSLQRHDMKIFVYWDGEGRRMKAATTSQRKETRDTEWSHLKQYCLYGVVPRHSSSTKCRRDWLYNFPMSRLLLHQVKHSLSQFSGVTMIQCDEEADREVAKASADDPNCYCVGLDSDFCLFPSIRYVPLNTLDASGSVVTACVVTRAELAEQLYLPTEPSMVEFAILMGNDYVGNSKEAQLDFRSTKVEEILDYLREQGADYRVSSTLPQVQLAIEFTRALYEFRELSEFPLDEESEKEDSEDGKESTIVSVAVRDLDRPLFPFELDLSLAAPKPLDFSASKVVIRPLQSLIDSMGEDDAYLIQQRHLNVFLHVVDKLQHGSSTLELSNEDIVRPTWGDIMAAYIIERTIAHIFRTYPTSPLVRISCPAQLFDHALFHSLLKTESEPAVPEGPAEITNGNDVEESKQAERTVLPIDEHEAEILDAVDTQRVTIIHGETGCGKSSRVPVMLLRAPPPDPSMKRVKMFISQPRRIAAKSLVERVRSCEPELRDFIALRMGHGVREYETSKTRAWFVTTGYLVRLLANHPEKFDDCSHLIIDEVHERSVDTDILCLLCRRLLDANTKIRLILMSATMAATLYQQYFGVPQPPIHVGARRFPIQEYFIEDLVNRFSFPPADMKAAKAVANDCDKTGCKSPPSNSYMENLFRLSVRMIMCVGRPGSSILVFVPGMNEIVSITDLVEKLYVPGSRFTCYPIHSDIPFEEQMTAFDNPDPDEVKVVIATNAAESSVTLPNVDHVICLGLCKQIVYNARSHRQMLMPAWISRASAIQRAGRTGRVRKGNVYRLYTRAAFENGMDLFDTGEMLRIPLDSVILTLKEMIQEEATPVLLDCLEPPDLSTIERSFKSLCASNFITKPDDSGNITKLGKFVSSLGIDLALGSLIGLGIQFGVGPEAIEMAAVLSFPKTPWLMTNPLFHDPPEYNDITARTFSSRCHFDANLYSEPLAIMNLMSDFARAKNQNGWAWHYSLSTPRLRRLIATRNSLRSRVAEFTGIDVESLSVDKPPAQMEHSKITLLRVIQVWVFSDTMIESIQAATAVGGAVTLSLTGDNVTASLLEQVLDSERHPVKFVRDREIVQSGTFTPVSDGDFSTSKFLSEFEYRLISYAVEKSIDVFWYSSEESFHFFALKHVVESESFETFIETRLALFEESDLTARLTEQRRGVKERPCGLWDVSLTVGNDATSADVVYLTKWTCLKSNAAKILSQYLSRHVLDLEGVKASMSCTFTKYKKKKGRLIPSFSLASRGKCSEVTKTDLNDLFATPDVMAKTKESESKQQKITFLPAANMPISYGKQNARLMTGDHSPGSSWHRPLLHDIPEGARLLSVLASGRRKEHSIRFSPDVDTTIKTDEAVKGEDVEYLEVYMNQNESKISQRWNKFRSNTRVFVTENSVPAAAMSTIGPVEVFACCANTLEVRGGGLRAEGLTLLPPGRLFTLLSLLTFGLTPFSTGHTPGDDLTGDEYGDETLLSRSLKWLNDWEDLVAGISESAPKISPSIDRADRILAAMSFHGSCAHLGEALVCHPDRVRNLCKIFDNVDGYKVVPWDGLDDNPFTEESLCRQREKAQERSSRISTDGRPSNGSAEASKRNKIEVKDESVPVSTMLSNAPATQASSKGALRDTVIVDVFPKPVMEAASRLFATTLKPGESIGELDLPSTNILCVLVQHYCDFLLENNLLPDDTEDIALERRVTLTDRHWLIRAVTDNGGKEWYFAEFVGTVMPFLSLKKRGSQLPGWLFQGRPRPTTASQAMACVPPHVANIPRFTTKIAFSDYESGKAVFFDSIEMALRMEAAFWLERQFGEVSRHWYQQTLQEMMTKATTLETVVPREF